MITLLDCNDASLRLWRNEQDTWSPGFAWFNEGRYRFGEVAWQQARRAPREVNSRYWHRLSTQPLSPTLGPARHTADLAHAHLEALLGDVDSELTLAVPGAMESDQLSLLLGILQSLRASVGGVVHRSALVGGAVGQSCIHVELQLHQASITPVLVADGIARAGDTHLLPGHGLLGLMDDIAELIGQQFVAQTRFDPQRRAETEQKLYEQIPALLQSLATQSEASCTLDGHVARIAADRLQTVGAAFSKAVSPLINGDCTLVALDSLLAVLPGLDLPLPVANVGAEALPVIARGVPTSGSELIFQREVPCPINEPLHSTAVASPDTPPTRALVTHQLIAGHAAALQSGASLVSGVVFTGHGEITIESGVGAHLNGSPVEGVTPLKPGDQLTAEGVEIQFIAVEP